MIKNHGEQKISSTSENFYLESCPISQLQIQQKYVHLQTILMLTQLNSAYYQMQLSIYKTISKVQNKYYSIKMKAFTTLRNYKSHLYEAESKAKIKQSNDILDRNMSFNDNLKSNELSSISKIKGKASHIVLQSYEQIQCQIFLSSKRAILRFENMIRNKINNTLCFCFYRLLKGSNQNSTLKILSDKSSKIQTIDSQKSKIFKRSVQKRVSRKSFSLQKSINTEKNHHIIPIKFQPNHLLSTNSRIKEQPKIQQSKLTELNKLIQKNTDNSTKDRRNIMIAGRQRKILKSTSTKKYNTSLVTFGKQEKLNELEYLERKYKKLIDEFNWFSERFLKVIQQQTI